MCHFCYEILLCPGSNPFVSTSHTPFLAKNHPLKKSRSEGGLLCVCVCVCVCVVCGVCVHVHACTCANECIMETIKCTRVYMYVAQYSLAMK